MLIVGWILLGSGPICLIIGLVSYGRTTAFIRSAERAEGVVVKLVERGGRHGTSFAPVFEFTDAAGTTRTIYSTTSSYPPRHRIGDRVTVMYDRNSPEDACLNEFFDLWGIAIITGAIGLSHVIFGLGMVLVARWAKRSASQPPDGNGRDDAERRRGPPQARQRYLRHGGHRGH